MSRKKYIDRRDIDILNALKKDPNLTIADLAEQLDLTPGPTHTRLNHLKEEEFLKSVYNINYSKFGITEHIFSFELLTSDKNVVPCLPEKEFKSIIKTLAKSKESLITNVDLLQNEKNKSFSVMVRYFNRVSLKTIEQRDARSKDQEKISDLDEVKNLLAKYINNTATFTVARKEEISFDLGSEHIIKQKPVE